MGSDKVFLEIAGKTLLQRACELAKAVADHYAIVGSREDLSTYGPVVRDTYPERGPLGGIYSALAATNSELNLIFAVDLPLLRRDFLTGLRKLADREQAIALLPRVGGRLQPLCAFYRKEVAKEAERTLKSGINKVDALLEMLPLRVVEEDEVRRLGGSAEMFTNVNTRQDYQLAVRLLTEQP